MFFKDSAIEIAKDDTKVVTVIHNARRRQVYGFMDGFLPEGPWLIDDIIRIARESLKDKTLYFYGDGIDAYKEIITTELNESGIAFKFAPEEDRYQDAVEIARCALKAYERGELMEYEKLLPEYMREAEAEQKLKAGELPISRLPKQE